jgi:hypothetical protein
MSDLEKVKPGEIERAVWSAMIWAAKNNPGSKGVPEYTDGGNSFAEDECRATAARIRAALTPAPAADVKGLVEALKLAHTTLSGANMNMLVVERKVRAVLAAFEEDGK